MPDFEPYLIFCLYLSRMQKYAFFPVCANILGENPSPARFFSFSARVGVSAFLQTKRGRKGKNALFVARYLQKRGLSVKFTQ